MTRIRRSNSAILRRTTHLLAYSYITLAIQLKSCPWCTLYGTERQRSTIPGENVLCIIQQIVLASLYFHNTLVSSCTALPCDPHTPLRAHAALCVWRRLVKGLCTVGCAVWGAGAWLGFVWRLLLVRWCLGALSRGMFFTRGALVGSVVAAGVGCGRQCRLRCRLGWCTRRATMARQGFLLVPVHMGVCCAGGLPAGRCRLLCVVFPVLCVCAATTVCMLCSSYLCSGFFSAPPDAYSALCLVLYCTAPLDVSKSHTLSKHICGRQNLSIQVQANLCLLYTSPSPRD